MKLCLGIGLLFLAGCVTTKPVALPSGQQGLAINCPGTARDISDCMNEAARVCGGPYKILNQGSESTGGAFIPVGNGGVFAAGRKRTLIVSCGAS
jgi:hypothetical protein